MFTDMPLFEIETDPEPPVDDTPGELETAAVKLFADLETAGLMGALEQAKKPALLATARGLDKGLAAVKVSVATANMFKQYMETLEQLPKIRTSGNTDLDALDQTLQALTREALSEVDQ
ncbi:hypothetical protein HMPREF0044_0121 [Gleimia coleocanis DSM 15436]|uniref:Uncharacterized protein n=1 Tax=Gleimia coleocanis DSM 15436 TaxID=525245 RepID=C0VY81_9ACTO|nr:hypothetical protein [Gleimia coleocanis]EEH64384.1 hypothetical protein HMPREF0044_0121 [Gleimia coleocanis DSM 15436]